LTEVLTKPVDSIVWDPAIYPREKYSTATIERYADALRAGAEFPPIAIEAETDRLLDGKHRLESHKKAEIPDIRVRVLSVPEGMPIKLFAASLSSTHGDRLTNSDAKKLAREIAEQNPDYKVTEIARYLSFQRKTVDDWVGDIVARNREQRTSWVRRLGLLGWTQDEIGKVLGWRQNRVSQIINFGEFAEIDNSETNDDAHSPVTVTDTLVGLLASGLSAAEVATRLGLSEQLVRAIDYQRRRLDDATRFAELDISIQPYDVWHFAGCHDLMGDRHPGRIPGELVAHVLYFWTKQGDLVIDPMAGSGTTADACLLLGRRCYSYDIDHHHNRYDILDHNIAKDGWPERTRKADLIFWDPPYFDKKDDEYVDGSVSRLPRQSYLDVFRETIAKAHETVQSGTRFAFLMSDWDDPDGGPGVLLPDYARMFDEAGWAIRRRIQCPLSTQQVHPDIVLKFREARRLARLSRDLLVAIA
jgi:hypothetical protein